MIHNTKGRASPAHAGASVRPVCKVGVTRRRRRRDRRRLAVRVSRRWQPVPPLGAPALLRRPAFRRPVQPPWADWRSRTIRVAAVTCGWAARRPATSRTDPRPAAPACWPNATQPQPGPAVPPRGPDSGGACRRGGGGGGASVASGSVSSRHASAQAAGRRWP